MNAAWSVAWLPHSRLPQVRRSRHDAANPSCRRSRWCAAYRRGSSEVSVAIKRWAGWPVPGSEDTELGVLMELEVGHGLGARQVRRRSSALKGRKVAIKYRDRSGNSWAGRGAQPVWLREKLKAGAKLEDFAVHKSVASRKAFTKKSKKRRKAKR